MANTVRAVFPSCRVFRENEPPTVEAVAERGSDFDNVILFCVKTASSDDSSGAISFRKPREADYLQSLSRQQYLYPQHEVPDSALLRPMLGSEGDEHVGGEVRVLRQSDTEMLAEWHTRSARNHWTVMRRVLPQHIWESW